MAAARIWSVRQWRQLLPSPGISSTCVDSCSNPRREKMLKKLVALLALAGLTVVVAGCNTVEGAGKDIKAGGAAIEKSADQAKKY
jgi:predicted small secreted protein